MPTPLKEFLAQNPAAQTEHNQLLDDKYKAGVEAGKKEMQSVITEVSPFLTSEAYDSAVKQVAVQALKGEIDVGAFKAMIALDDARKEKDNSTAAATETDNIGDTPAQIQNAGGNPDGTINTEADFQAEVARFKGAK